ncbi:MJ0042-type zinc finger domain-containing protein [Caulobacter sp. S45]|uniref:MJ0042-type zinc finger domain-containing protein n=1 Tax=Caulobacter sp. S45 TaxID=1641861 RepID=UPI00131D7EB4|nr:MJ0042-type zinc finger domain-containing protein [Caulobacter sp. S45]
MILTCPHCATRYFVDEARLGPQGRTVRCAGCQQSWRAEAPEPEPLELTPEADPDLEAAEKFPDDLPKTFRARVEAKRRTRRAVAAGAVWAALAAGLATLMLSAAIFRVQMVQLWPRTAGAYAALRMPVNPLGLAPDGVQAATDLQNGQAALTVTGAERNVDPGARAPAPLRVSLYDKAGHRLAQKIVRIAPGPIQAGESRPFRVSFLNPPLAGAQVGVDFVFEPRARAVARPSPDAAKRIASAGPQLRARGLALPTLPTTAAKPARSVPQGSPYALPAAARGQTLPIPNG